MSSRVLCSPLFLSPALPAASKNLETICDTVLNFVHTTSKLLQCWTIGLFTKVLDIDNIDS